MEIIMRTVQTSLLAGAAMILFAGVAQAQSPGAHLLTIHLPGGGIEQIRYSGDVPPEIFLRPDAALADSSLLFSAFGPDSPFATLDRISEEMDLRAARLLEQAEAMTRQLPSGPDQVIEAHAGGLPPNGQSYTFVSTTSANGICGRSVEVTSSGNGGRPHVVTRSFGHCGGRPDAAAPETIWGPFKPRHRPDTIMADAQSSQPSGAQRSRMVQEAAWRP
jgi:hypothetical protein